MVLPLRWQRLCSCFFELWRKKKKNPKKEGRWQFAGGGNAGWRHRGLIGGVGAELLPLKRWGLILVLLFYTCLGGHQISLLTRTGLTMIPRGNRGPVAWCREGPL